MVVCIYHTLFGLELEGYFGLYQHQTDDASLLFYTTNLGRFTLPLCYNFLQVLGEEHSSLTAFLGKLNLLPVLGDSYAKLFPAVFAALLLFKLFNLHGRLLGWAGLIPEHAGGAKWKAFEAEGRKIVFEQSLLVGRTGEKRSQSRAKVQLADLAPTADTTADCSANSRPL